MFGEDISNLVGRGKILNTELVLKNFITNKKKVEFNMLCSCMRHRIGNKMGSTLVVTPQNWWCCRRKTELSEQRLNLSNLRSGSSQLVHDTQISALLLETIFCLVNDHETKFGPMKIQQPLVLLLSYRQEAQSASVYA